MFRLEWGMYSGNNEDNWTVNLISTETKKPECYTAPIAIPLPKDSLCSVNIKKKSDCVFDAIQAHQHECYTCSA